MSLIDNAVARALLWPGMKLMRVLRFPAKVAVISAAMVLPLSWLTASALLSSHESLESTRREARGNPLLGLSLDVIAQTQKHRGLVNLALAGDASVSADLTQTRAALKAAIGALQSALILSPEFDLVPDW